MPTVPNRLYAARSPEGVEIWIPENEMPGYNSTVLMGVSAWSDAVQSMLGSEGVPLTFNRELWDTDGIHSIVTSKELFTVPIGGAGRWQGFFSSGATFPGGAGTLSMVARANDNFDVVSLDFDMPDNVERQILIQVPPILLAEGDTMQIIPQNNDDVSFGSAQPGPNPADPYGPAGSDSALFVFWRTR